MAALQWPEFVLLNLNQSHNSFSKNLVMRSSKVCINLIIIVLSLLNKKFKLI